ncbi:hypothetical protein EDB89DRAFT_1006461 [Lactarius sanguifluus]|nr:hypothetical protein EDB89DRAFT_1006461 [Lactarius sanguifluus]
MVFFALDDFDSASTRVPLYVLDAVQQTSSALYQDLPPELNAKMRLDILLNVPDGTSSLTAEMYTSILRGWVKNLWHFTREYNQCGSSVPLPSYVSIAFANPELSRRIREQRGLAVRVMGRCVEVLVVNKLAADIRSRNVLICNDDLACLSAILGTKSDDVMLLLSHPGAIAFTNMVFLTLGNLYSFTLGTVPSYVRDLVQQTSSTLSQALPPELSAKMRLNQTNTLMYASNGTSSLTAEMYRRVLNMWMKNLWHFTRDYNRRANSVPLPSYVSIAFTNQEMTHRILGERDPAVRMIGRCIEVLVVNKLATEIKSRNDSDQLACVSTILGTKSDDVMLLLSHPGAIEFTNMIFLALDDIDSSAPGTVPIDMLDVIQQTSSALSKALPPEMSTKMRLNQAITLIDVSDAEMYLTILRVWMKNLWDFTRGYNERGNSVPLPSYISVSFTNPEMTCRIRKQRDLAVRMVARTLYWGVGRKQACDRHKVTRYSGHWHG